MVLWPQFTIFGDSGKISTFGAAWDIYIADHANSNMESYAFLGGNRVYELPDGVGTGWSRDQRKLLTGTDNFSPGDWEVFHLT